MSLIPTMIILLTYLLQLCMIMMVAPFCQLLLFFWVSSSVVPHILWCLPSLSSLISGGNFSSPCSISSRGENIPSALVLQGSLCYLSVLSWYGLQFFNPFYLMILWSWWYYDLVAYVSFHITSWRTSSEVNTCSKNQLYCGLYCKVKHNTCSNYSNNGHITKKPSRSANARNCHRKKHPRH